MRHRKLKLPDEYGTAAMMLRGLCKTHQQFYYQLDSDKIYSKLPTAAMNIAVM